MSKPIVIFDSNLEPSEVAYVLKNLAYAVEKYGLERARGLYGDSQGKKVASFAP